MKTTLKRIMLANALVVIFCAGAAGTASAFTLYGSTGYVQAGASINIGIPLPMVHVVTHPAPQPVVVVHEPAPVRHVVVREAPRHHRHQVVHKQPRHKKQYVSHKQAPKHKRQHNHGRR